VAGSIGGLIIGALKAYKYMSGGMGLFALPCFINPNPAAGESPMRSLIIVLIAILIAMVISFVGTMVTWQDGPQKKN
jgi:PTS system beta-glucosides-specific IIC component